MLLSALERCHRRDDAGEPVEQPHSAVTDAGATGADAQLGGGMACASPDATRVVIRAVRKTVLPSQSRTTTTMTAAVPRPLAVYAALHVIPARIDGSIAGESGGGGGTAADVLEWLRRVMGVDGRADGASSAVLSSSSSSSSESWLELEARTRLADGRVTSLDVFRALQAQVCRVNE